ncbi:MAG: transcription termination/antitermination protein NusA [Dehalococcoidia bacterium]|jgi:N utilization substance protein A|nr:MAG: transcription termination/antitermination protein NusA [Dehalococcoidia bacterium]
MKSDFLIAITQLSAEKNLSKEVVLGAVESALVSAYRKDNFVPNQNIKVKINPNTGAVIVWADKEVVEKPTDTRQEISLVEASRIQPGVQLGDIITVEATPSNAGRIAAQTAKQVILQRLHEAEHSAIFEEYANKEGDILIGVVQRIEPKQILLDLGRAEAVMPVSEQMPNERYRVGQRLRVYLLEVARTPKGPRVILSRSHPNLLRRLFELEVPEVYNGVVEIKSIAREAGHRSKIAVAARQEGIDPVGCCVGLRGIRIQNIVNELSGEKIDVVQWHPDPKVFISHALSPAQVQSVALNEAEQIASVIVPDRQLSLAIGREGQNVRLAAKLTGWRIDIRSASEAEAARAGKPVEEAPAVAPEKVMAKAPAEAKPAAAKAEEKVEVPAVEIIPEAAPMLEEEAETEEEEEKETVELVPTTALRPPVPIAPETPAGQPVMRFAEDILELRRGAPRRSRKKKKETGAKGEGTVKAKKKRKGPTGAAEDDARY